MKKNTLISVIIPAYNREKELGICLRNVFQQDYPNKEVIVIDNGSRDRTIDMITKNFPQVKIIRNSLNTGTAYSKNQGVVESNGEFIWFLDSDSIILDNLRLSSMVHLWKRYKKIGALGGEVILDNQRVSIGMRVYDFYKNGMSFVKAYYTKDGCKEKEAGFLPTFNLFTSKKILYQIGGFDPYYFYLAEDKEICFKIRKLGYRIISNIETSIFHNRKESYEERLKKPAYSYNLHKNRIRFAVINFGLKEILRLPIVDFVVNEGFKIKSFTDMSILILAYLRNIIFLPREILIKLRKPNFLKKMKWKNI